MIYLQRKILFLILDFFLLKAIIQSKAVRAKSSLFREKYCPFMWIRRIHMMGHGKVVVCMPYNFCMPKFVSDVEFIAETSRNSTQHLDHGKDG